MAKTVRFGKNKWKVAIINSIVRIVVLCIFCCGVYIGYQYFEKYREKKQQEKIAWEQNVGQESMAVNNMSNEIDLVDNGQNTANMDMDTQTEYDVSGQSLYDLQQFNNNPYVLTLLANNNNISDLSAISGLTQLRRLEVAVNNITSLQSIAGLTNLEHLALGENAVSDISCLSEMKKLKVLDMWKTPVSDISCIQNFSLLEELSVSYTNVTDISAVMNLTNLKILSISGLTLQKEQYDQFVALHPNCHINSVDTVLIEEIVSDFEGTYIMSKSDKVELTKEYIEQFSIKDRWMAKNEIYARKGRKFKNEILQQYFELQPWYHGTIEADQFDDNSLSTIEKKNVALLIELGADTYTKK